jgi:hypothetical protein
MRKRAFISLKVHDFENGRDPIPAFRCRHAFISQAEIDVVVNRFPGKERKLLEHDGAVGPGSCDLALADADLAT